MDELASEKGTLEELAVQNAAVLKATLTT